MAGHRARRPARSTWCSTPSPARSRSTTPSTWRRSTSTSSLLPYAPAGAAQLDWAGAQNLFNQGKPAMMRFWGHAYRQTPEDSPVKDSIGVAPMIGGPGGIAGVPGAWYLSVPAAGDEAGRGEGVHRVRLRAQRAVGGHVARAGRAQVGLREQGRRAGLRELRRAARHARGAADAAAPGDARSGRRSSTPCWCRCCRRPWSRAPTPRAAGRREGPDRGDRRVDDRPDRRPCHRGHHEPSDPGRGAPAAAPTGGAVTRRRSRPHDVRAAAAVRTPFALLLMAPAAVFLAAFVLLADRPLRLRQLLRDLAVRRRHRASSSASPTTRPPSPPRRSRTPPCAPSSTP